MKAYQYPLEKLFLIEEVRNFKEDGYVDPQEDGYIDPADMPYTQLS